MTGGVSNERRVRSKRSPAVYVTHVVASERVKYEGSVTYHPLLLLIRRDDELPVPLTFP